MNKSSYILSIDQGTTSSRAIIFDETYAPIAAAQEEFKQHFPNSGWVEHDPQNIWRSVINTVRGAFKNADVTPAQITGIGITNQRETIVIWNKHTGAPIHNAIVWQDRRTSEYCKDLRDAGHEEMVRAKTGLLIDPYFSATKIKWMLDTVDGARTRAENGDLLCGTIDTFILWKLTGGAAHKTDATNASRTLLYNIHSGAWDTDLLALFDIPAKLLPTVHDCAADFGHMDKSLFGAAVPILGMAGDQHAALIGQGCFEVGMGKSTYGTGCFIMCNTGDTPTQSNNRLLTTIGYQLNGKTTYALEGSIFIAGAAVQWLRDGLKIIDDAPQADDFAVTADGAQDVILVPAFAGLGAPYWNADVRGAMFGLTRNTGVHEICRAALEAVCYQTRDLIDAMRSDIGDDFNDMALRADGGMARSDWTMQFLSDILNAPIDRSAVLETTALGVAWLAGYQSGTWGDMAEFAKSKKIERRFNPIMNEQTRAQKYGAWQRAVACLIADV